MGQQAATSSSRSARKASSNRDSGICRWTEPVEAKDGVVQRCQTLEGESADQLRSKRVFRLAVQASWPMMEVEWYCPTAAALRQQVLSAIAMGMRWLRRATCDWHCAILNCKSSWHCAILNSTMWPACYNFLSYSKLVNSYHPLTATQISSTYCNRDFESGIA